jgi:hypothetical protein
LFAPVDVGNGVIVLKSGVWTHEKISRSIFRNTKSVSAAPVPAQPARLGERLFPALQLWLYDKQ